jgi:PHD/YefM family antitoxin component YafN of YafNO toxin-antitoxin module
MTMIRTPDIHSLSDFQRNTKNHVTRLKQTGRPEVLTINGRAELVVQDAAAYQDLLDRLDRAESLLGIERGLASMHRGESLAAKEGLEKLRAELGVTERVR